ncbi:MULTISPECIES: CHAT domain-containing protein [Thiorhodovibrio]|uniref:CHAT domain-containing protein n=1 Tax=Thiorhodovibrio TaxID=61593 RepID=UPI0019138686|nr:MULTISPECIES: CHAT domain-containing protein [Thiorhodovibrio]MBK5968613.1 hypothetical protein [Thiorhodovibrio winogradskyi]WPL11289.1 CHAT domain protein [Thiorhodovibrio litoralis]
MRNFAIRPLILTGLLTALASVPMLASSKSCEPHSGSSADVRMAQPDARQSQAIRQWSAQIDQRGTPAAERIGALLLRAESYRSLAHYRQAGDDYAAALKLAKAHRLDLQAAIATLGLGEIALAQNRNSEAAPLLDQAARQASDLDRPTLIAASANALGNLKLAQGQHQAAAGDYRAALAAAKRAGDTGLVASARVNLAALAGAQGAKQRELNAAYQETSALPAGRESVRLLLRIAYLAQQGGKGQALARKSLTAAAEQAQRAGLPREGAEALGQSAKLAGDGSRQARDLLLQALQLAPIDAYDLRYQWEWQLARSFEAAGDRRHALAAYRRAVGHLEKIRGEIPVEYAEGRSSFRETLEPLYLGLSDLLLQEAAATANAGTKQQLLREARDNLEQLKVDELRDYFRDACIQPLRQKIDAVDRRTAVLYPVLFPERLELILSAGGQMVQQTLPVARDRVELAAQILAVKLRYDQPVEPEARELYDWLIAPVAPTLRERKIDTLVFVPDGALRTVPVAVLRSPTGYLIEDYAVATTPGLQLLAPKTFSRARPKTLIAGVSQPGPVVDELPEWWVGAMVQQHRRALARGTDGGSRGVSVPVQGRGEDGNNLARTTRAARKEKIDALSLPGVEAEIDTLSAQTASQVLRNQDFLLDHFVDEVEQHPYRIVHIASHGLFQGPPEENFIVTYDHKLDMGRLAAALKPRELDSNPIELLVLSACQTAEGDDRTPLGLSGVALQSGARSALGSLWPVGDSATQQLMARFYEALADGKLSKASALRQAQQAMIKSAKHSSPSDWAAFILVGNWM